MRKFVMAITFMVAVSFAVPATGTTLTFDDLPDIPWDGSTEPVDYISSYGTYGGLTWDNMDYGDPAEIRDYLDTVWGVSETGYTNGMVSSNQIAYNTYGLNATITSVGLFDFYGAYLNAAWSDSLGVTVRGYSGGTGGTLIGDNTVTLNKSGASYFAFNYLGIDTLEFSTHGYGTFVMDNFNYRQVPEPATLLLLGSALLGFGMFHRMREES